MKHEKFIIRPGKICTFDTKNLLKKDTDSIIHVEVVDLIKKKPFGRSIWSVIGAAGDENILAQPIHVPEFLLSPVGMSIIRNPTDFPVINEKDIQLLKELIYYFDNPPKESGITFLSITDKNLNRLKALLEKMELSRSMRDV